MGTSTERNPTHVYTDPGVYNVTLTVFGVGGTDSYTRSGYITVNTPTFVLSATVYPTGAASITGLGTYSYGDTVTLTANPAPLPPPVDGYYVDVVFMVDESGSMSTEHTWLQTMPNDLEAALLAAGIGTITANRYALAGFGSDQVGHEPATQGGHKHVVGGGDWGTAAQCATAAAGLVAGGSLEDGYQVTDFVLSNYSFRANAVKVLVLITDEQRTDITGGTITKPGIITTIQGSQAVFAAILNLDIQDTTPQACIGRQATTVYIKTGSPPYFTTGTLGSIVAGPNPPGGDNANAVADYCDVAESVGGTEWDLNILRNGGTDAQAFTSAFVTVSTSEIIESLTYVFSHWSINGTPVYTNPYMFVITGPTTIGLLMVPPP